MGLVSLRKRPDLELLGLTLVKVSDAGVETLAEMKSLRRLIIQGTNIRRSGVVQLQQSLPECQVFRGKFDRRREIAARIIGEGGKLTVKPIGQSARTFTNFDDFPDEFETSAIDLSHVKTLQRGASLSVHDG